MNECVFIKFYKCGKEWKVKSSGKVGCFSYCGFEFFNFFRVFVIIIEDSYSEIIRVFKRDK